MKPVLNTGLSFLLVFLLQVVSIGPLHAEVLDKKHLLHLRYGDLTVGVLPQMGGRLVLLNKGGSANLLRENRSQWQPEAWPDSIHLNTRRTAFYGHIHWLAPQSRWWAQQDLLPGRKGDDWPPDPFLELGRYTVLTHTDTDLVLSSPDSPVSGVRLLKRFELLNEHSLRITAEAINIRDTTVSWGLWSNVRFPQDTKFRANFTGLSPEDIRYSDGAAFQGVISDDGQWFTFVNDAESLNVPHTMTSKAFFNSPSPGFEVLFGEWILRTLLESPQTESVHPEHATTEIFLMKHPDKNSGFLELEFHSVYQTLQPDEKMSLSEVWKLERVDSGPGKIGLP